MKFSAKKLFAFATSLTICTSMISAVSANAESKETLIQSSLDCEDEFLVDYTDVIGRDLVVKTRELLNTDYYIISSRSFDEIIQYFPSSYFILECAEDGIYEDFYGEVKREYMEDSLSYFPWYDNFKESLLSKTGLSLDSKYLYRISINKDESTSEETIKSWINDGYVDYLIQENNYVYYNEGGDECVTIRINEGTEFTQEMADDIISMLPEEDLGYTLFDEFYYESNQVNSHGCYVRENYGTVYSDYEPEYPKQAYYYDVDDEPLDKDTVLNEISHVVIAVPTCLVMTAELYDEGNNQNIYNNYCDELELSGKSWEDCLEDYGEMTSVMAKAWGRDDLIYSAKLNDVYTYLDTINKLETLPFVSSVPNRIAEYSDFDYENTEVSTKDINTIKNEINFTVLYSKDSDETEDVTETAKVESTTEPTKAETEQTTSQKTEKAEKSPTIVNIDLGDVNGDNSVNSSDAVIVLQDYSNSIITGETALDPDVADVNQDGEVDSIDAVEILKNFAFTIISFE
jgi:hypothetical protein